MSVLRLEALNESMLVATPFSVLKIPRGEVSLLGEADAMMIPGLLGFSLRSS